MKVVRILVDMYLVFKRNKIKCTDKKYILESFNLEFVFTLLSILFLFDGLVKLRIPSQFNILFSIHGERGFCKKKLIRPGGKHRPFSFTVFV